MAYISSQQLTALKNLSILNDKGADAFTSSNNPILDLFTLTSKVIPDELSQFTKLVKKVEIAKNSNPEMFVKLLKFHRLIEHGNGIKGLYYICMIILKEEDPMLYEYVLKWSNEYPKDILRLTRISSMFNPTESSTNESVKMNLKTSYNGAGENGIKMVTWVKSGLKSGNIRFDANHETVVSLSPEIVLYGNLVFNNILNIIDGKLFDEDTNLMLFKYLGYESNHFSVETNIIWKYVEQLIKNSNKFQNLSTEPIPSLADAVSQVYAAEDIWKIDHASNIKNKLISLLIPQGSPPDYIIKITNKIKRKIKVLFNNEVNLTDKMFQGIHTDGTIIGSLNDDEKEIKLIYNVLKKTPTLSFKNAERLILKYKNELNSNKSVSDAASASSASKPIDKKKSLLVKGYEKYKSEVSKKTVKVKTHGLNLVSKVWDYKDSYSIDPILEEQINKMSTDLLNSVNQIFDESFTFQDFVKSLVLVLDTSGSMDGIPLNTGLFYMLLLVKVFGVQVLHYFATDLNIVNIDNSIVHSNLDLVKQVYNHTSGSTNLDSIFTHLNTINTSNKNIVIITDGDCDPGQYNGSTNPFHEVTRSDKENSAFPNIINNNYVVINVKETKMNFPYLNIDPSVCYFTGNNPKTITGFIKALCISTKNNTIITPDIVLDCTLTLDELDISDIGKPIPKYSKVMSDERIERMYNVFMDNLPKKKLLPVDQAKQDNQADQYDFDDWGANCESKYDSYDSDD